MQYDKSFKEETLTFSDEIGVKVVTVQLGIPYCTTRCSVGVTIEKIRI